MNFSSSWFVSSVLVEKVKLSVIVHCWHCHYHCCRCHRPSLLPLPPLVVAIVAVAGLAKTNGRSIYPDRENESGFLVGCLGFFGLIG